MNISAVREKSWRDEASRKSSIQILGHNHRRGAVVTIRRYRLCACRTLCGHPCPAGANTCRVRHGSPRASRLARLPTTKNAAWPSRFPEWIVGSCIPVLPVFPLFAPMPPSGLLWQQKRTGCGAPQTFGNERCHRQGTQGSLKFRIQVYPQDCLGCGSRDARSAARQGKGPGDEAASGTSGRGSRRISSSPRRTISLSRTT